MPLALGLMISPVTSGLGWTPMSLGSSLLAWWDSALGVSLSTDKVTAWVDRVAGYSAAQGSDTLRPTWSATSFNGSPGLTFDGTDDHLALASQPFPSGANACEMWAVVQQDALAADATTRMVVSYGGDASTARRSLTRIVSGGSNRFESSAGNGATLYAAGVTGVDFSSRNVIRGRFGATSISSTINTTSSTDTAGVPATGTSRLRIGSISNTSAGNYWNGKIRDVIVTGSLTADQVTQLQSFLLSRRNP